MQVGQPGEHLDPSRQDGSEAIRRSQAGLQLAQQELAARLQEHSALEAREQATRQAEESEGSHEGDTQRSGFSLSQVGAAVDRRRRGVSWSVQTAQEGRGREKSRSPAPEVKPAKEARTEATATPAMAVDAAMLVDAAQAGGA